MLGVRGDQGSGHAQARGVALDFQRDDPAELFDDACEHGVLPYPHPSVRCRSARGANPDSGKGGA